MLSLLLIFLIVFILWPLIRIGWQIWSNMRQWKRFMADPEAEMRRRAAQSRTGYNPFGAFYGNREEKPARRGKKISRDVGEYVAFTEVELTETEKSERDKTATTDFKKEEQITDVKWVDL